MAEGDLVSGDGWISDESSFYGDGEEQERLLTLCENSNTKSFWKFHRKDLNNVLAKTRSMPPPVLHNRYQGKPDAWQLGESVDEFVRRLPPLSTPSHTFEWIWCANPHPEGQVKLACLNSSELRARGAELLHESLLKRADIKAQSSRIGKGSVTEALDQESEALKQKIAALAEKTNILTGKWMLFPSLEDVARVWKMVVEGTINNRLGCGAKVATDQGTSNSRLICVYTKDFRDDDDVVRVLRELVAMGLVQSGRGIYYKSDPYTLLDIYSSNAADYGLQASMYSSQKMLAAANIQNPSPAPQRKQTSLDTLRQ
ncbi:DUF1917-domain-containing protein [Lojkania enalia]|uniref:DUF1917-domain-containing protein n=1 Tax=Lojkania enalia TaxID=147567 RepID=A0A9P4N6F5_9PLEO|nr:DUF1917-domain-containing protein [Didymosphaeria enalia]